MPRTDATPGPSRTAMFGGGDGATFMGVDRREPGDLGGARIAILGADTATPYASVGPYCAGGAAAIRRGSAADAANRAHWNFDIGGPALPDGALVDCGDVPTGADAARNRSAIERAVGAIAGQGAVPIVLGGDDSVPIPVLAALGPEPLWIVQIDAHIDWRDEVQGERMGLSSTMRRASEMDHVAGIIQIGPRGLGSARASDVEDAERWGAKIHPARHLADADPLSHLPAGARVAVAFDFDALDPAIMPAVIAPTAGGLGYWKVVELFERIAARADIVAVTMCEFMASADRNDQGAILAAQLLTTWAGVLGAAE